MKRCEPPFDFVSPEDIDDFERLDELQKSSGINILSDKELDTVVMKDDEIVGALYVGAIGEHMTFDIIVAPECQRKGIAKRLIDDAISVYHMNREAYGDDYYLVGDVVNPNIIDYLTTVGFEIDEVSGEHTIMRYREGA